MKSSLMGVVGAFFLTGAVVNDAYVIGSDTALTWAKVFFLLGALFSMVNGLSSARLNKVEVAIGAYAISLICISALSGGPGFTPRSISVATSLVIGALSSLIFIRTTVSPKILISLYIYWVIASVVVGVFQSLFGVLFFTDRIFISGLFPILYRASGFMSDPNYFAMVCLIALAFSRAVTRSRMINLVLAIGVVLSGSRAGVLCLMLSIIFDRMSKSLSIKSVIYAVSIVLVCFVMMFRFSDYLPGSLSMLFKPDSYAETSERNSLQDRLIDINAAVSAVSDNPIYGYGLGNFVYYPLNLNEQESHNTYLEVAAETGLLGFCSYVLLFYYIGKKTKIFDANRLNDGSYNSKCFRAALLALSVFSIMSLTLVTYYSRILFFLLAVAFTITKENEVDAAPQI